MKKTPLKDRLLPLLSLLFVIALSISLFYLYRTYPDIIRQLSRYGYLGIFVTSLTFNATVILPAGNILVVIAVGGILPSPIAVGIAAGAGAAIGESTGYLAGYSGRQIVEKTELYQRIVSWMKRWGMLTIIFFAIVPLFFDVVGLAAGVLRLPYWKFLLACFIGRTILYIFAAYAGFLGWEAILRCFG